MRAWVPIDHVMVREDWYRRLAQADLLIVEARERMQSQKGHIAELTRKGQGTGRAIALLRLFEETLQLMHVQRTTILQKVRRYELPVYEDGKVVISLKGSSKHISGR